MTDSASPRTGLVIPRAPTRGGRVLGQAFRAVTRGLEATLRWHLDDPYGAVERARTKPSIYAIWHNRLALSLVLFRRYIQSSDRGRRLAALVSASRDGATLSAVLEAHGVVPVRGSSSRRGAQALLELTTRVRDGFDVAVTPDGPRGPRYRVQSGVVALARLTGLPIVPVAWNAGWKIELSSWDRFQIPLPGSRCDVVFGEPLVVARDAGEEELSQARERLEASLRSLVRDGSLTTGESGPIG